MHLQSPAGKISMLNRFNVVTYNKCICKAPLARTACFIYSMQRTYASAQPQWQEQHAQEYVMLANTNASAEPQWQEQHAK